MQETIGNGPLHPDTTGVCYAVSLWGTERLFLYASYGLREWIGARSPVPDLHIVDRETLEPIMEILGSKETQIVPGADGIAERDVPADRRTRFCLSVVQVSEIASLAKAVETRVGAPVRIEWECRHGTPLLVSVRRIRRPPERNPER